MNLKGKQQMESNKLSSKQIGNGVFPIIHTTPSSEDHFETKLQSKFDKSDQILEQQEEELMGIKVRQHQKSKHIEKSLVTIYS